VKQSGPVDPSGGGPPGAVRDPQSASGTRRPSARHFFGMRAHTPTPVAMHENQTTPGRNMPPQWQRGGSSGSGVRRSVVVFSH